MFMAMAIAMASILIGLAMSSFQGAAARQVLSEIRA